MSDLSWIDIDEGYMNDLQRAEVTALADDGTPIVLFKLHARPYAFDVQDSAGHVFAQGRASDRDDARLQAQGCLHALIANMYDRTGF